MQRSSRRRFVTALAAGALGAGCTNLEPPTRESVDAPTPDRPGTDEPRSTPVPGRFADVYGETIDSVVQLRLVTEEGRSQGSGFVYADGYVVTNQHVVRGADTATVRFATGEWADGIVVGADAYSDLAVLSLPSLPDTAEPLPVAREDPPIGTEVLALGNPLGYDASITAGIVSGVNRSLPGPNEYNIPDAVQTDASLNPGNSGGPLLDLDGTVVAVINSGRGDDIGFGISAPLTRRVVPALIEDGSYDHPLLGASLREVTPPIAEANGMDRPRGIMVVDVLEDGPSEGILHGEEREEEFEGEPIPVGGDVILEIDGEPMRSMDDLGSFLAIETSPGDTVAITVLRDGRTVTEQVTLGRRPDPEV